MITKAAIMLSALAYIVFLGHCIYDEWKYVREVVRKSENAEPVLNEEAEALFEAIKHGDEGHQAWLRATIHAFFNEEDPPLRCK